MTAWSASNAAFCGRNSKGSPSPKRTLPWLALILVGFVGLAFLAGTCAQALARRERAISADEVKSTRLVTYELKPGETLRVPIEPGTDVIRVVAHALRHGPLSPAGHAMRWRVGASAPIEVVAPGSTERVLAETAGDTVGDPVAFALSSREYSRELNLTLDSLTDADAVLLRLYRRETLSPAESEMRRSTLSLAKREHLASRAGELGWLDLTANERGALVSARWQKVAPLPADGHPLRAHVVSLEPPVVSEPSVAFGKSVKRAQEQAPPELSTVIEYTRISPEHPALVQAAEAPLVLRARVRAPLLADGASTKSAQLSVEIKGPSGTTSSTLELPLKAAPSDRYRDDAEMPSASTTFFALVPAHARATLRSGSGELDLALAELDPSSSERRFVARRASNFGELGPNARRAVYVARRAPAAPKPLKPQTSPHELRRVERPSAVALMHEGGRSFVPGATRIPFVVKRGERSKLHVHLHADVAAEVTALIDGGAPHRRSAGLATTLTTARTVHLSNETKLALPLGDDLEPGRHVLSFQAQGNMVSFWVHLPWAKRQQGRAGVAWVSGDFEP